MDGLEGGIVKGMLKPAGGVVDALLSAKLDKLKAWSYRKVCDS